ncbi:hypothetical protein [Pseudomonas sp. TWI628]|uniref:hypothetical protein n=1 Tax=Pseudomonas sp. TWI628 TaxID=3136788 RepID=UPI003209DCA3
MSSVGEDAWLEDVVKELGGDDEFIENTEPLMPKDERLVGRFVQQYCWADFNSRRAINYLRQINGKGESNFSGGLNDTDVVKHLGSESASLSGLPAVSDGLGRTAKALKMHRDLRHHFAHWAVRRAKHHEAFVLMTTNSPQAKKKGIAPLEVGMLGFSVVAIEALERELGILASQNEYLAQAVNFLGNYIKDPASVL